MTSINIASEATLKEISETLKSQNTKLEQFLENLDTSFNPQYSNAVRGIQSGNIIELTDGVNNASIDIQINACTTDILKDSNAEKSIDNPSRISGTSVVYTTIAYGKNLFDASTLYNRFIDRAALNIPDFSSFSGIIDDNVTFKGRTCIHVSLAGFIDKCILLSEGKQNTQYTVRFDLYMDSTDGGPTYIIQYTDGNSDYINPDKYQQWATVRFTTKANKTVKSIMTSYRTSVSAYYDKTSFMIYEGSTTIPYENFNGVSYRNKLKRELHSIDAIIYNSFTDIIYNDKVVFNTAYMIGILKGWQEEARDESKDLVVYRTPMPKSGVEIPSGGVGFYGPFMCSHFKYDPNVLSGDMPLNTARNYIASGSYNSYFEVCVSLTRFPTAADFEHWTDSQVADGYPFTIIFPYIAANVYPYTPYISLSNPIHAVSNKGATILNNDIFTTLPTKVEYTRDINKVLDNLERS